MTLSVTKPTIGQPNATEDPKTVTGLTDIETWGNLNDNKIIAILGAWKLIYSARINITNGTGGAGDYWLPLANSGPTASGVANGAASASTIAFDPAHYAISGFTTQVRVILGIGVNGTAPAITFTAKWAAITVSGGVGTFIVTVGATTASAALVTPAANTYTRAADGTAVTAPVAGGYALVVNLSGTAAANSVSNLDMMLQYRYV